MRFLLLLSLALFSGSISSSTIQADALLLPQGTTIEIPGNDVRTLDASYFLLNRVDMERAVLAMETVPIREKQIADLTLSYKTLSDDIFWKTVKWSALTGAIVFVAVEVVHLVKGK